MTAATLPNRNGTHRKDNRLHKRQGNLMLKRLTALLLLSVATLAPMPAVSQTDPCDGALDWTGITPDCLSPGDPYRILFVTSNTRDAQSGNIADYNTFVQNAADGVTGTPFASITFRVLGSTSAVNARDNTGTTGAGDGIRIFYYRGRKVADSYTDFYDGTWDTNEPRHQDGMVRVAGGGFDAFILTGTNNDGATGATLGTATGVGTGDSQTTGSPLSNANRTGPGASQSFYGLSEVLTPPSNPAFDGAESIDPQVYTVGTPITTLPLPEAANGNGVLTYTIAPTLPDGLTLGGANGNVLSGTPELGTERTITDYTYMVSDADANTDPIDTDTIDFTITVNAATTPTIFGDLIGFIAEDAIPNTISGTVRIAAASGTTMFTAQTAADSTYGSFTLTPDPSNDDRATWTYTLDNDNSAVNALASETDTLTDTFTIAAAGVTDDANVTITITGADDAPTAVIAEGPTLTVDRGDTVTLTSTGSNDPESAIASYRWRVVANGNPSLSLGASSTRTNTISFTAPNVATTDDYTIGLIVNDGTVNSAEATIIVTVVNPAIPSITIAADTSPVTEGTAAAFTLTADPAPGTDLIVTVTVTDSGNFIAGAAPTTVTITASETTAMLEIPTMADVIDEANGMITATVEAGTGYTVGTGNTASVTVDDDDTANVAVSETTLTVAENGGTMTYTIMLDTEPTDDVTITPESDATLVATVLPMSLTFTPSNWNTPQTVTVTGVDDSDVNTPARTATVTHTAASTADSIYEGLDVANVVVTATDDDAAPGPTITIAADTSPVTEGTAAEFTLTASPVAPTGGLTVTVSVTETGMFIDGTPPPTVTIAASAATATLTVATTDDNIDEIDGAVMALLTAGVGYMVGTSSTASVAVNNDDDANVAVSETTRTVAENGGTMTYTIMLDTEPLGDVTITPVSDATLVATVSSALTFTTANWNTAQTVTVTGVNDSATGDRTATVNHTPASTADSIYAGLTVANVVVTATDDDATVALLEAADPTTLGARRLNSSTNRATVRVTLMNTVYVDTAELSGDDFTLTDTVDGDVTVESAVTRDSATVATLTLAHTGAISSDGTVSVTVLDSAHTGTGDLPAVSLPIDATAPTVSTVAFSTTGPYGLGDNIEVTITFSENVFVEGTNPNALLIIGISANQAAPYFSGEGSNTLVFRRTVGAGDNDADGVDIQSRTLLGGGGLIRDAAGNNVVRNPSHGQVNGGTDQRIDPSMGASPSITIAADTSPVTEGTAAAFTLTADPAPAGDLTITVSVSQTGTFIEGVAPTTVTIAAAATTAALMVATTDDDIDEAAGEVTATVEDGTDYTVGTGNTASVTVNDDDTAGVTVDPLALTVDEAGSGTTADYTLVLDTVPTADVTIAVASDTDTAATVSSASLTFTPTNWNTAQTVTVTGVNDDVPGDRTATVTHTAASTDDNYEGGAISIASVTVTVTDDDAVAAGVTVDPMTLSVLEADGTADYTLVLDTAPTADVTIAVASDTVTAATVSSASLTFTPANWNTAQTVTVTGVNDDVDNPSDERTASLSHTAASADGDYSGGAITIASVTVTVTDDDDAGVTVDPLALTVDEAGSNTTADYTLVLDTVPTADVTIAVASDTVTAATVSSASLTFTPANWNTAQTVTVTGVNDDVPGDRTATVTHTAASTDGNYEGVAISIASVTVTVEDDDGVAVPSALLAAADPTTLGERRLNNSTNRATVTVTLMNTVYEPSADLMADDFMLSDTVDGDVTVNSVTRDSGTAATLALAHTGAISSDGTLSVTVLDSAHTGAGDLPAGSLPIDATAPTVSSVAFSTAGPYGLGADIEITITFSENVFVTGVPNVRLEVGSNRNAAYNRGSGGRELVFRRTVVAGDGDLNSLIITSNLLTDGTIRDAADNDAVRTYTGLVDATQQVDATLPMLSTATVDGDTLVLTYAEALDGASTPANGDYVVMAGSSSVTVSDVSISGMAVTLTLATPVTAGQTVTLDYTPGSAPVQDTVGNDAVMLDDQTVMNNTPVAPSITIAAGTSPVTEGTAATFTLTADPAPAGDLTVTVTVTDSGNFIAGAAPTTVTITGSETTAMLEVSTMADAINEANGMITATVEDGSGYTVGTGNTASVTVNDDDAVPTLAIDSPSVAEGDAGDTPTLSYTVTLTGATEQEVTVDYADADSGTATSGTDYEAVTAGTLTFAPGTTTQNIDVTVMGDVADEGDETVILTLSNPVNATIPTADGTGTITDDDGAPVAGVTVDPMTLSVLEADGTANYTLVLDTAPTADVTIAVASDTVTAATVSSASLTFTPTNWNTAQTVTVTGVNDDVDNPSDERTATVTHVPTSTDAGYTSVVIASVTVTVTDDDDAGVTVDPLALMVPEASGTSTYTVVLDTQPIGNVTITPESGDTMTATVSGALTFTTTDWSTAQTVTVTGVDDSDVNTPARTATVSHTPASADDSIYAGLTTIPSVVVTATDDDGVAVPSALLTADTPLGERDLRRSTTNTVTVMVTLMNTMYVPEVDLDMSDFTLTDDVAGVVTVSMVTRTSDRVATLRLTHGGEDIASDGMLSVTVRASAHTRDGDLPAGSLPIDATAPTVAVNGVGFSTTGPYGLGDNIEVTIIFSENVFVNETTPNALLDIGSRASVAAAYNQGSGSNTLVFRYTVVAGDDAPAPPGAQIRSSTLSLGGGIIRDAAGNDAVRTGTNTSINGGINQRVDAALPMLSTATVDGTALTLTYNEALDDTSTTLPSTADYTVTVGTASRPVNDVAISGMTVTLTLASVVTGGQVVILDYTPGTNPVRDTVGNNAAPLDDQAVTTIGGTVAVTLDTIAGDNIVNILEKAAGFPISGTMDSAATEVSVTIGTGMARAAILDSSSATWTIAISADDADITGTSVNVVVTAMLSGGATGTVSRPLTVDLVPPVPPAAMTYTPPPALTVGTTITDIVPSTTATDIASYLVFGGTLPPGLTLASDTGVISGAPTMVNVATATVDIILRDGAGNPATVQIIFPAVGIGSQTLTGFAYTPATVALNATPPAVTPPSGAQTGSTLSYTSGNTNICTVDSATGALTLVAAGDCTITVTASMTANYNEATDTFTITVSLPAAGVTVTPTELTVPEDGTTMDTYTLVLDTAPTADVTIAVASDTVTAATVSSASLTFTSTNWDTAQTVTVTGVNDDVDNPSDERTATVTHVPTSTDAGYGSVVIASVTVTVTDDDDAGVTVDPTTLSVLEADGTGTYTLVLDTVPTADVTIAVASDTDTAATVSSASLTFTPANWNTAQTVTVTGVNDNVDNPGNQRTATVLHPTVASTDSNYDGVAITVASVTVTVTDDDDPVAGVTVTPPTITVSEDGSARDTYTLVLNTMPSADVTITVASSDTLAATVSPETLTFTTANWNTAQTVTVTGVSDTAPGDRIATVTHTPTSTDTTYNSVVIDPVTVTVEDDDAVGVTVSPATLSVPEDGTTTGTYTLVLDTAPTADVTIAVASDTVTAATVSSASLTFTPTNWNTAQTVTVTGVDDDVDNPSDERTATVTHVPTSADAGYTSVVIDSVTVTVTDDDDAGVTVDPLALTVDEADGTGAYTLVLNTMPSADVTIAVASDTVTAATVSSASLTFTPANWNTAQTVTVTGVNDNVDNPGNQRTATVLHPTVASTDSNYDGVAITVASVTVTVTDDDDPVAGVTVTPPTITVSEDGSARDTYTLVLDTMPSADVTITVASSDTLAATVSPETLTFTTANWNTAQEVIVTGVSDTAPGDRTVTLSHTAASTDSNYNGGAITIASVTVTVTDDDVPAITIAAVSSSVTEGAAATFTLTATPAPAANLTVTVTVTETGTFISGAAPTTVTIPSSGSVTLTVLTTDDATDEANGTITATVTAGTSYTVGSPPTANVTVEDNDGAPVTPDPAITIAAVSSSVIEGAAATFTLTATPAPAANLTVTVTVTETGMFISGAAPTTVTIPSSGSVTLTVSTTDDATDEANGTITATVTAGTSYTVGSPPTASVTVEDNDPAPVTPDPAITIAAVSSSVTEGAAATFTLTATPAPAANLTVTVTVTETGTFISGAAPTTVTIPSSGSVTLTVSTTDDATDEANGTITATVTAGTSYTVGSPPTASVTVEDNDPAPVTPDPTITIAAVSSSVTEGAAATFTLTATPAPAANLTVTVTVTETGTFISGAAPTTVTIPSSGSVTLTVPTTDDATDEANGMITATVTAGSGYTVGSPPTASVTVEDDDGAPVTPDPERIDPELTEQLQEEIASQAVQTVAANVVASVGTRIETTIRGAPPTGGVQLDGKPGLLGFLDNLPEYGKSIQEGSTDWKRRLANSSFSLNVAGDGGADGGLGLWGSGHYTEFDGDDDDLDWDGDSYGFQVGVDTRWGANLLTGISVSWSEGDVEYTQGSGADAARGDYTLTLTGLHPYLGWSNDSGSLSLWASAGYADGKVEIEPDEGRRQEYDASVVSVAGGFTRSLTSSLSIKGDFSALEADIDEEDEVANGRDFSLDSQRARLLLEGRHQQRFRNGGILTQSIEAGYRLDEGDSDADTDGAEVGGSLDYQNPATGLTLSGKVRGLVGNSNYREWGISGLIRLESGTQGLSFTLEPGYGDTAGSAGELWQRQAPSLETERQSYGGRMKMHLGYGLHGGVMPYTEVTSGEALRSFRMGVKWQLGKALDLNLFGEQYEADESDHSLQLEGKLEF